MTVNRMASSKATIGRFVASLGRIVLPATCCLCDSPGSYDLLGNALDLCGICRQQLPINRFPCTSCALPLRWSQHLCAACTTEPPAFDRALAPYLYAYPVGHLVRGLKFRGERGYGRLLGQLLAAACARSGEPPEVLVPIPLHDERYRQRGFNQAQEIGRAVAANLRVPLAPDVLIRRVPTAEQSSLPLAERPGNVRGAFAIRELPRVRRLALIDDVLTSGSTASEAARVLKEAGIAHVEVWVVARVPRPGDDLDVPDV